MSRADISDLPTLLLRRKYLVLSITILLVAFVLSSYFLFGSLKSLTESGESRYKSYLLADELRQSSDDLTRMVRTFAATGNKRFEDQFKSILAIRNGEQLRPKRYNQIYWDFLSLQGALPSKQGEQQSLMSLMIAQGINDEEIALLRKAQDRSNALVNIENVAIRAINNALNKNDEKYRNSGESNRKMALRILHGEEYHKQKAEVMSPIREFFIKLDERTESQFRQLSNQSLALVIVCVVLVIIVSFLALITMFVSKDIGNKQRKIITDKNHDLEMAKSVAEDASRAKSEFLSSMSHELRTPMNAILGFTQMLEYNPKEPLTETQQEAVNLVLRGGNHLLSLIDEVLELSKIEAGQMSLTVDHVSLRHIVDECLPLVQMRAEENNVEIIDATSETDLPLLWTDETRLKQVLLNLLSNAVKYNRPSGTVTISSQEMPNLMMRLSVTDTGEGIAADKRDDVFTPFDRLGREAKTIEGTGIGLTITKRIIEVLGGTIDFESEENKGSIFWIDVPMSENQDIDAANVNIAKSTGKMIRTLNEEGSQHSVLYVEDEPANIKLMEMIIGRLSDIKLLTAHNAELGLDLAKRHKPDLILMDINLPGMNGLEILKQLQDTKETKDIPVIALTAAAMDTDIKAGFRTYITKPINVEATHKIIQDVMTGD